MPAMNMKMWIKKNKTRMEIPAQGAVMLMDIDAKTVYMYMPAQNMAVKMPYDPSQTPQSPQDAASAITGYNPKVIGTETIDGKSCLVVQYDMAGTSVKSWIWQDKGMAIRAEMTSSAGKTIIEFKNIDFSDIPDSMFTLPSGVNITSY